MQIPYLCYRLQKRKIQEYSDDFHLHNQNYHTLSLNNDMKYVIDCMQFTVKMLSIAKNTNCTKML